jgi:hypothetical protein
VTSANPLALFTLFTRRALALLAAVFALAGSTGATWSIVVVNRRTGEICIASATCIPRQDLTEWTPVLLVGVGGGVTQSVLDDGSNKVRIWEGFLAGDSPPTILERIRAEDPGVATRQFGIVDFTHDPLSFTGRQCGQARKSVSGYVDDLAYAIQGNILVSQRVIDECEAALLASHGDTAQRVMAAMVRARELGGDGRCSCGIGEPLGNCGEPAPDFEKSAHIGYLILARMGDTDGGCIVDESCVTGDYHLRLSIFGPDGLHASPDPVDQLVERLAAWRAERLGRPDGIRSLVDAVDALPADGRTERTVRVQLVDLEGDPLTHGGAVLEVASVDGAPLHVGLGPIADHGDGSYSFVVHAGAEPGLDRLAIRAHDDLVHATLYPYLALRSDAPAVLHAGVDRLSASAPRAVPLLVSVPERPGAKYWLFASLAGGKLRRTGYAPGLVRYLVPNRAPFFPAPPGILDASGRDETSYAVPPAVLRALVGLRLEWTASVFGPGPMIVSDTVGFDIVP